MKRAAIAAAAFAIVAAGSSATAADNIEERTAASRAVVKAFASELQGELKAAIKAGGPVKAISVCHEVAPDIAARHGRAEGWEVGRTSLNYRNPDNAPDDWERPVLQSFDERNREGADPQSMERAEFLEMDGKRVFRYMKAIPTGEVCLNCHGGDSVKPEVEARIDEFYPNDKARGYSVGDIRGAFTIVQPVE